MDSSCGESSSEKFELPGLGFPLDYVPKNLPYDLFPNALNIADMDSKSTRQLALTLREISMLNFMDSITDKADWQTKVNDDQITSKWKTEACETEGLDMTSAMADYCIAELCHKATLYTAAAQNGTPPPIVVYPGDVVKSDTAVSAQLKLALQAAVKTFEDAIPVKLKDWHPGSNDLVWDLVHPSLCPLVYGRSRVLPGGKTTTLHDCVERCGEGIVVPVQPKEGMHARRHPSRRHYQGDLNGDRAYSNYFQWLPCEVDIARDNARITTYVNNLHPKREKTLYNLLEKLIDASIPLWNRTLAPHADHNYRQPQRIGYSDVEYDPDPENGPDTDGPQQEDDEDEDDYLERRQEWIEDTRELIYPEPEESFSPHPEPAALDLRQRYGKTGLQVIVKLANIQLTPESPEYEGGSWHVEGQMNERIVATALYYYSSENITSSTLGFRQQVDVDCIEMGAVSYAQNDNGWLWDIFGCKQEGGAVQELGSVETREGRLLTFPNILQHRVDKFELADPTKPGHRKIVALFLVDPNIKVISTAHVPCQQQEWWWECIMAGDNTFKRGGGPAVDQIPIELQGNILEDVDFPMSLDDAKALRLELMDERRVYVQAADAAFRHHTTFNLCEH
ncbi:hypothetical protein CPB83DRAFT_816168 [Crepidotus variabilis]|uniref:Uncharacterized protein n=1 Tax=Crepidotus variabilis TaxID=179855 RepID=A0A9P6JNU0_9AGAR|nr:hypothetical protein CPB83DRAFT_816168 [Crepidotus variabilis]